MESSKIKSLEESVITAMDGSDVGLFPFLPYILQDSWELGSDPNVIINLVRKHVNDCSNIRVLDLGCGKGAVSIKIAGELKCTCFGIDAVKEFIDEANHKAKEYGVEHYCYFEVGDIRERVKSLKGFDIIILGSIGPVFGDYTQTLRLLKECITDKGIIIIDDGYTENKSDYTHHLVQKQDVVHRQISDAGMKILDEVKFDRTYIKESNAFIFKNLKKRCLELIKKYPGKRELFNHYLARQEEENEVLEQKIICSVMIIKKNNRSNGFFRCIHRS